VKSCRAGRGCFRKEKRGSKAEKRQKKGEDCQRCPYYRAKAGIKVSPQRNNHNDGGKEGSLGPREIKMRSVRTIALTLSGENYEGGLGEKGWWGRALRLYLRGRGGSCSEEYNWSFVDGFTILPTRPTEEEKSRLACRGGRKSVKDDKQRGLRDGQSSGAALETRGNMIFQGLVWTFLKRGLKRDKTPALLSHWGGRNRGL